jgi:His/Glu/Gln/Arg/opine family amino acid ABC transporter permease subunit
MLNTSLGMLVGLQELRGPRNMHNRLPSGHSSFPRYGVDLLPHRQGVAVLIATGLSAYVQELSVQFQFANQGLAWSDAYFLAQGLLNTVRLAATATLVGTLAGIALGWLRTVSLTARIITAPYIDILRSVPMMIQLILASSFLSILGFGASAFWFGTVALSAWMSAVTAEVVRAGLLSVPIQYSRSARSLGMNGFQELFYISMPLAFRDVPYAVDRAPCSA